MLSHTSEGGGPIGSQEIEGLERKLGVRFPQDYRLFLLKHNGGRPHPALFEIDFGSGKQLWRVHFFLSVNDSIESCRIDWMFDVTRRTRPPGVVPIASDEAGNLLLMRVDASLSTIYFGATPSDGKAIELRKVADSFEEFLEQLK
jgi:hypothetical protein